MKITDEDIQAAILSSSEDFYFRSVSLLSFTITGKMKCQRPSKTDFILLCIHGLRKRLVNLSRFRRRDG